MFISRTNYDHLTDTANGLKGPKEMWEARKLAINCDYFAAVAAGILMVLELTE